MKKRVLSVILSILLVFSLVPTAFAADADGNGYNDHDYAALRDFLNQPSADGTNTNGQQLNDMYDPLDPSTWSGVTWTDPGYDEELHVQAIDFNDKSLAGSLNVSGCTALQKLSCSHNQLTSLDISECATLYWLDCNDNKLTTLDLSGHAELETLECIANQLTTLDLSGCPGLGTLLCGENQLKTLDVSGLGDLRLLSCSFNSLASLDVSANTALYQLDCRSNALSTLDTTTNTNIATLLSMDNPMTQLSACIGGNSVNIASGGNGYIGLYYDMELYSDSQDYYVQAYPVASTMFYNWTENGSVVSTDATLNLDGSRDYDLTANFGSAVYNDHDEAAIKDFLNQNSAADGQKNAEILGYTVDDPSTWSGVTWTDQGDGELHVQMIDLSYKSLGGSFDVSGCMSLMYLNCSDNQLTSLDISGCTMLQELYCSTNQLTTLDVSGLAALDTLYCYSNQLTTLDVSGLNNLKRLDCAFNSLASLGLSGCTALQELACHGNQLTTLDVSGCAALDTLYCYSNQLATLDISGLNNLKILFCGSNSLASLDVSADTALEELYCSGNALSMLDTTASTNITMLDCTDNPMTQLSACIGGRSVSVDSSGSGYIGLFYDIRPYSDSQDYYVQAYPVASAAFYNWTENGSVVSTDEKFNLDNSRDYDLTANWTSQVKTAFLAQIDLSAGSLSRPFAKNTYSYKIYLAENQGSVTLTPVKEFDGATMTINRQHVSSYTVNVAKGKSKTVTVKVTYGRMSRVYTFVVKRAK